MIPAFLPVSCFLLAAAAPNPAPAPPPAPPMPAVDMQHLPWQNGESLTYLVSWETFQAAEGTFVAKAQKDGWEFDLSLGSAGIVNTIYPFTGTFWCLLEGNPWRSIEYGEFRFEPRRTIKERTRIDYVTMKGTREQWAANKTKVFPVKQPGIDDIGTMLYHLRTGPWAPGDKRTLYVYESDAEKQALAECVDRETRAFGAWPAQPLLHLSVLPTKGTHHKGHLALWMTDDARRLPIHAELEFRYGTFDLDLTKAEHVAPAGP
jgi:hypothetical protein